MDAAEKGIIHSAGPYSNASILIMAAMGWDGTSGLGKRAQGIIEPVQATTGYRHRAGLGSVSHRPPTKPNTKPNSNPLIAFIQHGRTMYGWATETDGTDPTDECTVREARLSPRGLPISTGATLKVDKDATMRVLRWGGGVIGPAESTYPHPKGWTFSELRQPIPLDRLEVRRLPHCRVPHHD